jgi:hypothetical protein
MLSNLSGGDLEDMMRAVAAASGHSPLVFLQVIERHHVDRVRITSIARMLPLSSVDNVTERRRIVRERISALRSVAVQALAALDQELH